MATPAPSSVPNVSRFTGLVLGLVVFICVSMIGFAGFVKYEIDRAENVLAAPDSAPASDQEVFDKLRRSLGYSGVVGMAQNFAVTHDAALLPDIKARMKTAHDMVAHLPEKTTSEERHDLQAIVGTYDTVIDRADKSAADSSVTFATSDMAPIYAALPVLDARVESAANANRLSAQDHLGFWTMLLTLVSWCSLIIAAATCAGIYLALRSRNSAPLRALVQSVKNMARGDMRSAIWGMERQDMVGEVARAVDLARYHFSQLPDMSLLSDQGPVRIRFEGNTRSLFEAMMQLITRDSEQVRVQAAGLTEAISRQQTVINQMSSQVETLLHNVLQRGHDGNRQVSEALQDMLGAAHSLKNAQEHASDQLNRIVPFLQERAHGMAEITHITGKQVAQVLQSLTQSEYGLRLGAEQSQEAVKKLSSTADSVGERLFGAINLLQASGKVLAETTENTQSHLNEAIERLNQGLTAAHVPPPPSTAASELVMAPRIEAVINALEKAQKKLEERLNEQTAAAQAQINLLATHSSGLLGQTTTTAQTLSSAADHLREGQQKFDATIAQIADKLNDLSGRLEQQMGTALSTSQAGAPNDIVVAQLDEMNAKLSALNTTDPFMVEIKSAVEATGKTVEQLRKDMASMAAKPEAAGLPADLPNQMRDHWYQMAAQIEATRTALSQIITEQIARLEMKLAGLNSKPAAVPVNPTNDAQQQMIEQQTQILTELVATLGVLDTHMQQLKSEVKEARA